MCAKGVVQHLKHLLRLDILEPTVELIIHCHQHYAPNGGAVIEPLLISVSDCPSSIRDWLLRYRIRYYIKDPLMLKDDFQFLILAIEIRSHELVII